MGKIVCIPGIVTSTSKTSIRARRAVYTCQNCGHEKVQEIPFGLYRAIAPAICDGKRVMGMGKQNCRLNPYVMDT